MGAFPMTISLQYNMESSRELSSNRFPKTGNDESSDHKKARRLAQCRENNHRARMKKKEYIQHLETRNAKLTQIENELDLARKQGMLLSITGDTCQPNPNNGSTNYLGFLSAYTRWIHDQNKHIQSLQTGIDSHSSTYDLQKYVHNASLHFNSFSNLKRNASKVDVCHIIYGMWSSPTESCLQWIGGFRSSNLLTVLLTQLDTLTHQQNKSIIQLRETTHYSEQSLSHRLEEMHQSLFKTLSTEVHSLTIGGSNFPDYMAQMSMAIGQFSSLEHFLVQADQLREKTLNDMHAILTTRQSAQAIIHIHNYFSRLRAMSTLWVARQQE